MEKFLRNIFDDFNVDEAEGILNEIEYMPLLKEREELRSRILVKVGIEEASELVEFNNTKIKRKLKWSLKMIRNVAACFAGVILLSSISAYAFSGKSLFDFFLQQEDDKTIGSYVEYDGDSMFVDNYEIKVDSFLLDEEIGSGYCVLTVEDKDKINGDLKKFLNRNYIYFTFNNNSAIIEGEHTVQDGIMYIPIFFSKVTNKMENIKLWVIGASDYVEEKGTTAIEEEHLEKIVYDKDSISEVDLGYFSFKSTKKLQNKHKTFQTNAKLTISSIGLMIEDLDEADISGNIIDLSIEYRNGENEIFIENNKVLSEYMNIFTESNFNDTSVAEERFKKTRILYGKVIELESISKININGDQIDLN